MAMEMGGWRGDGRDCARKWIRGCGRPDVCCVEGCSVADENWFWGLSHRDGESEVLVSGAGLREVVFGLSVGGLGRCE